MRAPLDAEIRHLIETAGPMPVARYMALCLTHPEHGYYMTRDPLGRDGDFITSPEISQMFGELLGVWAASVWKLMGAPAPIQLIELGPGRGTLMMDALRALRVAPAFLQNASVHLVEINPALREKQAKTLANAKVPISWHATLDEVPEGPAIVFANEFFDALPVHQAIKAEDGWHERVIEIGDDNALVYGIAKSVLPRFDLLVPPNLRDALPGTIFEWREPTEAMRLARRIRQHGGAALVIDYGHIRSDAGDTFQAIAGHAYADPLMNPGEADLTAHVDFEALARAAEDGGARVHGPAEQGSFLVQLGIETRAAMLAAKAEPPVADAIEAALHRLASRERGGMGALFKVLAISEPSLDWLPALSEPAEGAGVASSGETAA